MKNILILGGSYAGVSTAHRVLKGAAKSGNACKVTLVCPNTHFYWNLASPRAVIPGELADEKLFVPLAAGFKQYSADKFELIHAYAENLDVEAKTVTITSDIGGSTTHLKYDFLILATGSETKEKTPFKTMGSTEQTKDALHSFQAQVKAAKSILVAGAGITGVEIVGELASEYGDGKRITLLTSGPTILGGFPETVTKLTTKELHSLKVEIKTNSKAIGTTRTPQGQHEVTLSDGRKLVADMYISAAGLVPNSSYVPAIFLNNDGYVKVDEYLRVKGAEAMWAIGDISDVEPPQFKVTDTQSAHLASNILHILNNKTPLPYKIAAPFRGFSIGKKAGTGHWGTWRLPSFMIVMVRKNLFLENMVPTVDGTLF